MYDILPPNEKSFDFKEVGATTGLEYEGRFKCKCILDISGKHALELEKTRLMADFANPTGGLEGIALTIATIRAKLTDWPSWWEEQNRGLNVLDENIIMALFDAVVEEEINWRAALRKKAEAAKKPVENEAADSEGNEKRES